MASSRTPAVAAARKLTRPAGRAASGRFLAEGPQAVREALRWALSTEPGSVHELFGTAEALRSHADLLALAAAAGVRSTAVSEQAADALSETVTPQGIVAVCAKLDVGLDRVVEAAPRLVVVLVEVRDPGNAGTVLRTADAMGAGAVVFAGAAVDPYNGKCVRAGAGSLFHLPVVCGVRVADTLASLRAAGLQILATDPAGETGLDQLAGDGSLERPTAWLFGNEAHGLPQAVADAADARVRIAISGAAESLNLSAAAAICLYASSRASADRARPTTGSRRDRVG